MKTLGALAFGVLMIAATATHAAPVWGLPEPQAATSPHLPDSGIELDGAFGWGEAASPLGVALPGADSGFPLITDRFVVDEPLLASFTTLELQDPMLIASGAPASSRFVEPGVWSLLIVGLGGVGALLRLRLRAKLAQEAVRRLLFDL